MEELGRFLPFPGTQHQAVALRAIIRNAEGRMEWINSAGSLRPVDVEKLFDRYYTVNTGRQATGLGLTIAKGLAEQQGGTLQGELRGGHLILTLSFPPERGELK